MYTNISGYKFVELGDLEVLRAEMKNLVIKHNLNGTIYVCSEGVNIALAGLSENVSDYRKALAEDSRFSDIFFKESFSKTCPFHKVVVKIKPEVIAMGIDGIEVSLGEGTHLEPEEFKQWLDHNPEEVVVLDTRNHYEYNLGTFDNAIDPKIKTFKQFPAFVDSLPEEYKEKKVVIFCTGGIRCEKAAPMMKQKGFNNIYQIHGGILNYLEKCGGEHWHGDCFIFDDRVAVNAELKETGAQLCRKCHNAITAEHTKCPYCVEQDIAI